MYLKSIFTSLLLIGACGDNAKQQLDAPRGPGDDAPNDGPRLGCTFKEAADATNDIFSNPDGVPEATGASLTATSGDLILCGTLNPANRDDSFLDVDVYQFSVATGNRTRIELTSADPSELDNIVLGIVALPTTGGGQPQILATPHFRKYAMFTAQLPAGDYLVVAQAAASSAATTEKPYELRLRNDPAGDCATTGSPTYAEQSEAPTYRLNDVVGIDFAGTGNPLSLTPEADAPEATGITLNPGSSSRLAGSSGKVSVIGSYLDRDTYLVTSAADTTELEIKLDWPDGTADLDWLLFKENTIAGPPVAYSQAMDTDADEDNSTTIDPGAYWLWIGGHPPMSAYPVDYHVSICARSYIPIPVTH